MVENLSGIKGLTPDEVKRYLKSAKRFIKDQKPYCPPSFSDALRGKTIALLFFEPSTRTRASFEIAAKNLGANTVFVGSENTSIQKGESIYDTCMNLVAMGVDLIVLRQNNEALLHEICFRVPVPIVNAGNGMGEHPTQALLDALTLLDALGRPQTLRGINISIIGDISHSRVARSEVYIFAKLGATVTIGGPTECLPFESWQAHVAMNRRDAIRDADAVVCLRVQKERLGSEKDQDRSSDSVSNRITHFRDHGSPAVGAWSINARVVETEMKKNAFILHPGPVIWGEELSEEVGQSSRSLILRQAGFGVAVRQAVLLELLGV